jgi:hypothetical protein
MMIRTRQTVIAVVLALTLAAAAAAPAAAEPSVRTIATVLLDTWFDSSFRATAEDVLLVGVLPALTVEARVEYQATRGTEDDRDEWQFGLGPVVNMTPQLYLIALYGLGVDSVGNVSHEFDVSLNHETASTTVSLGVKADFWSLEDYYVMPSLGGKFHPIPPLGLFGKVFVAVDRDRQVSGSFWGEADWTVTRVLALRAGVTMGSTSTGELGWSAIGGVNLSFTPKVILKYTFKYLAEPPENEWTSTVKEGIENGLVLDVRF